MRSPSPWSALAGCAPPSRACRPPTTSTPVLVSVRDGDRAGFEAHVDRDALKVQLRSRLIAETAGSGGRIATLGAALAAPLVDVAVSALLRPDTFRALAIRLGYDPQKPIPNTLAIAAFVKPLGGGHACVTEVRGGPCVLDFQERGRRLQALRLRRPHRLQEARLRPLGPGARGEPLRPRDPGGRRSRRAKRYGALRSSGRGPSRHRPRRPARGHPLRPGGPCSSPWSGGRPAASSPCPGRWNSHAPRRGAGVHLLVDPDARRRGVGRALLKAASQAARTAGCDLLLLDVPAVGESLQAFALANGFEADGARLIRPLRKKS